MRRKEEKKFYHRQIGPPQDTYAATIKKGS